MRQFASLITGVTILLWNVPLALASGSGQAGRTSTTSGGCSGGGCHAGSANAVTTVRIAEAVNGRITMRPNDQITLTAVVAHESRPRAGVGVAVKTTETGNVNAGSLTVVQGAGTRLSNGEITHLGSKAMTGGEAQFRFNWKAPVEEGTYFLRTIGNAVNGDGSAGSADQWNFGEIVQITVSTTASVSDDIVYDVVTMPVPAHDRVSMSVNAAEGEQVDVSIVDAMGSIVASESFYSWSLNPVYTWNGATSRGSLASPGAYFIYARSAKAVTRGKVILQR